LWQWLAVERQLEVGAGLFGQTGIQGAGLQLIGGVEVRIAEVDALVWTGPENGIDRPADPGG
jgi:hypothetical protein